MPPIKTMDQYSTNPSTIKARRRKMRLDGAEKVEDAAKTADYKAMVYARKVVQNKPEFKKATATEKSEMLERAMHETMEKRRARGQDTISKMAAFRAGEYNMRSGSAGPSTSVPISRFLVNNGYVPESASRSASKDNEDIERNNVSHSAPELVDASSDFSFNSAPTAPMADMDGLNGYSSIIHRNVVNRESTAPVLSSNDRITNRGSPRTWRFHRSYSNTPNRHSPAPGDAFEIHQLMAPVTPLKISPGRNILSVIEQNGHTNSHNDEIAALRHEVAQLHNMLLDSMMSQNTQNRVSGLELQVMPLDMGNDSIKVANLERRLGQLEGMMHTVQHTSLPNVMDQLANLEKLIEGLHDKADDGCAADLAKMREVFGSLRESLVRVGDFS